MHLTLCLHLTPCLLRRVRGPNAQQQRELEFDESARGIAGGGGIHHDSHLHRACRVQHMDGRPLVSVLRVLVGSGKI